jgi:hypothetical protein
MGISFHCGEVFVPEITRASSITTATLVTPFKEGCKFYQIKKGLLISNSPQIGVHFSNITVYESPDRKSNFKESTLDY